MSSLAATSSSSLTRSQSLQAWMASMLPLASNTNRNTVVTVQHHLNPLYSLSPLSHTLDTTLTPYSLQSTCSSSLPPAYHLLLFNSDPLIALESLALSDDGYSNAHSPPPPHTNRVWAAGSFQFKQPIYMQKKDGSSHLHNLPLVQTTRIDTIDHKPHSDTIFVWLKKCIFQLNHHHHHHQEKSMAHDGQARDTTWAELDPYYTSDEEKNALLIEKRCLAYLPHTAKLVDNPAKRLVKVSTLSDFSHTITPTPILLFRYSALTFNAHRIHYDPIYAREEAGHPDCLVHGPLTATLLLSLFQKHLGHTHTLLDFTYRALSPLYVNRPLTLHGKVLDVKRRKGGDTDSLKLGEEEESMLCELWCTNEEGGLAMKGTATMVPNK